MLDEEKLMEAIERAKDTVHRQRDEYSRNEKKVQWQLVRPIMEALGWDFSDDEQVCPEEETESGRADFALKKGGKTWFYLETKNLSFGREGREKAIKQLGRYCYDNGVDYGVLTTGEKWILVRSYESGKGLLDRIVWEISLSENSINTLITKLSMLCRERVEELGTATDQSREMETLWEKHFVREEGVPSDEAIEALSKFFIANSQTGLTTDILSDFLRNNWKGLVNPTPTVRKDVEEDSSSGDTNGGKVQNDYIGHFVIEGERFNPTGGNRWKHAYDILVVTAKHLVKKGKITGPINIGAKAGSIGRSNPDPSWKPIGNGLYVCVHGNFQTQIEASTRLLRKCGISNFDFSHLKAVPKGSAG